MKAITAPHTAVSIVGVRVLFVVVCSSAVYDVSGRCIAISVDVDESRRTVIINVYFPCCENSSVYVNELGHCIGQFFTGKRELVVCLFHLMVSVSVSIRLC